ncbi:MAG: glycosyltransferase 87 family protein [Vulcanimicrobiaceae bacterium]
MQPQRDELLPYVGPAAALPLFGTLARLPFAIAIRIWSGLLAAALATLVLVALAFAGTRSVRVLLAAFALALTAGPVTSALGLGQAALLAAGGIALALWALDRGTIATGALGTLIAAVQPNLALVLLARLRDRRAWLAVVCALAAFTALTAWGSADVVAYLRVLAHHGAAERNDAIQYTPAAIAWSLGAPALLASALGALCALAAIVLVVALTVRARLTPRAGTLLALAALPLAIPFFHEHDFAVELLALIPLCIAARGTPRVLAGVALVLVLTDAFGMAQRPLATGAILAQSTALACAFVALGSGPLRRADAAPFATLALVALLAIPLARSAPAPVWPDALGATYRAPVAADAGAVWADEQRTAGLDARQPQWGALRAFPLLGCLVLGIAVVRCPRSSCRRTA